MKKSLPERDKEVVWHPFTQHKDWNSGTPLVIERGEGSFLIDQDGRRYLDGVSSLWVTVHGHGHPAINQAITEQLGKIAHSTLLGLANRPSIELAERLVELAPGRLSKVFYSDAGSTAVEIALKQAFQYWQHVGRPEKRRFLYLDQAYHGDTLGAVAVGGIAVFHEVFGGLLREDGAAHLRIPSPQEGASPADKRERGLRALEAVLETEADQCAALIIEPLVQGAAGMLMQPEGYLRGVADLCARHQVLLIADEVATGFGRTGTMFACEQEGVEPDFLCVAKGLTGGYLPLAATLATDQVYQAFVAPRCEARTFYHGHTYTGNPVACAAALASIALFEREGTLANVAARSQQLAAGLAGLAELSVVSQVRQRGLMVGVDLVRSDGSPWPAEDAVGAKVCLRAREEGAILRPLGDTLVLMPPLSIREGELEALLDAAATAIRAVCL